MIQLDASDSEWHYMNLIIIIIIIQNHYTYKQQNLQHFTLQA